MSCSALITFDHITSGQTCIASLRVSSIPAVLQPSSVLLAALEARPHLVRAACCLLASWCFSSSSTPKRSVSILAYFWLPCCTASKVSCLACPKAASWRCPSIWADCCKRPASASWRRKSSLNPSACQHDMKELKPATANNSRQVGLGKTKKVMLHMHGYKSHAKMLPCSVALI